MREIALWIQIISQLATAGTAIVMAVLAWQTYLKAPTQEYSKSVNGSTELIIFDTSTQTTVLKASKSGLRCYLINKEDGTEKHQWTLSPLKIRYIISHQDVIVDDNYKASAGKVNIGAKKNWLYSKRLHPNKDYFKEDIIDLLETI